MELRYASNRGHDSIGIYTIDAATGWLSPSGWTASGGKAPRFFALGPSERFLFVANEDTDTVSVFERDAATGGLAATGGTERVGSPVCILFKTA